MIGDLQRTGQGRPLRKIITGINQRRVLIGLNPVRYVDTEWVEVDTVADGGISGIIQAAAFWRGLQDYAVALAVNRKFVRAPSNGSTYAGEPEADAGSYALSQVAPPAGDAFLRAYHLNLQARSGAHAFSPGVVSARHEPSDIIGPWLLDDLLALLRPLEWCNVTYDVSHALSVRGGGGQGSTCSEAINQAASDYAGSPAFPFVGFQAYETLIDAAIVQSGSSWSANGSSLMSDQPYSYTLPAGVTGQVQHVTGYIGRYFDGYAYQPIGSAPSAPGFYTEDQATDAPISIQPVSYTYDGRFPAGLLNVSCSSPGRRFFHAVHGIVVRGAFADMA